MKDTFMTNKKPPIQPYQKSLDRLWNALPLGCPMRVAGRELYNIYWSKLDPLAMAKADPTLNILHSPILAEILCGYSNESQADALGQHFIWLITYGCAEELEIFNDDILKCRKKIAGAASNRVAVLVELAQGLEHVHLCEETDSPKVEKEGEKEGEEVDSPSDAGIAYTTTREKLITMAAEQYPELFPDKIENLLWNDQLQKIRMHLPVKAHKRGAPLLSERI